MTTTPADDRIVTLSARPARLIELVTGTVHRASWAIRGKHRESAGWGLVLDSEVPILYGSLSGRGQVGIARAAAELRDAVILLFPTTAKEAPDVGRKLRQTAAFHRRFHPGHRLIFLCNTAREVELLTGLGEVALQIGQNIFVPDRVFRPLLPPPPPLYDAVYNARLSPMKRHDLSLGIERCAFIYYDTPDETPASDAAVRERHRRLAPGHVFLNDLDEAGRPKVMPAAEINAVLNRSAVGLCLSAHEGAMFASIEYLLAGLPVVSTPSVGGRDVYFDDAWCIIAEPDPRQVRDAVAALKARAVPREAVARGTLAKIDRERRRLLDLVDDLRERAGHARRNLPDWPWRDSFPLQWLPWTDFVAAAAPLAGAPVRG